MNTLSVLWKGAAIGIANIIPGVSGGTFALMLGIYERLINAIKSINFKTVIYLIPAISMSKEKLLKAREEWNRIDGYFLLILSCGAGIAIIALAKLMTFLLHEWHDPTYAFFFGLVLLSVIEPFKRITKFKFSLIIWMLIAFGLIMVLSQTLSPDLLIQKASYNTSNAASQDHTIITSKMVYFIVMGILSISAMILPGVSGSLILLLLGGYFEILNALATANIAILASFAIGCILGIMLFSRILHFLLKYYHDSTMSFLTGLVIGSLWIIWPFKTTADINGTTVYLRNRIPDTNEPFFCITILSFLAGMIIVALIMKFSLEDA